MRTISPELFLPGGSSKRLSFALRSAATQRHSTTFVASCACPHIAAALALASPSRARRIFASMLHDDTWRTRFHKTTTLDSRIRLTVRAGNHSPERRSRRSFLRSHAERTQHLAAKKINARTSRKASLTCTLVTPLAIDLHHFGMSRWRAGKLPQRTHWCSGITLCMEIFSLRPSTLFRCFTTNGAINFF